MDQDNTQSTEESDFERERAKLIKHRFKLAEDPKNVVPIEDLDYYLDKLKELRGE